ncbi:unnamed protein product, partial [Ectocarpus sp. 6 AP-2014]
VLAGAGNLQGESLCLIKELQLACLALCEAVRDLALWRITVGRDALAITKLRRGSTRGWGQRQQEGMKPSRPRRSRTPSQVPPEAAEAGASTHLSGVPPLVGKSVVWGLGVEMMRECAPALSQIKHLYLDKDEYGSCYKAIDSFGIATAPRDSRIWVPV